MKEWNEERIGDDKDKGGKRFLCSDGCAGVWEPDSNCEQQKTSVDEDVNEDGHHDNDDASDEEQFKHPPEL